MKYRVAMLGACPYPAPQGSQVLLQDTALALAGRGHEVHLVVYGYGVGPDETGLDIHRGRPIPGAKRITAGPSLMKPLLDLALLGALRRLLRQRPIDVLHAHNYEGLLVALAVGRGTRPPIVYHAHNAMADELPHFLPYTAKLGAWLDRTFPRRADRVIAPHQRLAEYLIACGCDPARVFVVPPPLDVAAFEPGPLSESMPPVLYTGNLDAYQRLDFLMRAMMAVRKTLPAARLIVATPHKARMRDAEVVRTPDFDSVRRVLSQDAVVACPRVSWSGYPIKVLNAMAAGKAVVACEGAAPPIVHNENGILVRGDDEEAFAQALVRLLTRPELRSRLGNKARETIGANHAPERIAQAVEAIYGGLIGKDER